MVIRTAVPADAESIAAIYGHHALHGIATFDVEAPRAEYWRDRVVGTSVGDHVLVAEAEGPVVGFAYSSSYRPRPAYQHTREVSVYLDSEAVGRGLGRALYDELLPRLVADGVHTALAVVATPNPASEALHAACGFDRVGLLPEVGLKFGRHIDTGIWARVLT